MPASLPRRQVTTNDDSWLIVPSGTLVRTRAAEVSILGRNTQGCAPDTPDDDERLSASRPSA
jgi:DNA gyrase subunit A